MRNAKRWLNLPDEVAILMGRFMYYASWLDDSLGEIIVYGNPDVTHDTETSLDWSASGRLLVDAIRRVKLLSRENIDNLADNVEALNYYRNHLVHGTWLWKDDHVLFIKRSLGRKGERTVDYGQMTYVEIEELVDDYKRMCVIAGELVEYLKATNPAHASMAASFVCPVDGGSLAVELRDEIIHNKCTTCSWESEASPGTIWSANDASGGN